MRKFAVHYRIDARNPIQLQTIENAEYVLSKHLVEPVRTFTWQHLKDFYFLTNEDGPRIAQLVDIDDGTLVYAGPI